ncbi:unnamed protein product, partial [Oppiella nova]
MSERGRGRGRGKRSPVVDTPTEPTDDTDYQLGDKPGAYGRATGDDNGDNDNNVLQLAQYMDAMSAGESPAIRSTLRSVSVTSNGSGGDVEALINAKPLMPLIDMKWTKQLAKRPALSGTAGRQMGVIANHFRLTLKTLSVYHYDIEIRRAVRTGDKFVTINGPQEK